MNLYFGGEKGDILLFSIFTWPSSRSHGVFKSQTFCGLLLPGLRTERSVSIHALPHRFEFRLGLRLVDPMQPVLSTRDWADTQLRAFDFLGRRTDR